MSTMATGTGRLIVLCGLTGAGKTTLAKQLEADGAIRMCPDEWLVSLGFDLYDKGARVAVERLQWELAQALVLRGLTVVDECGVWQRGSGTCAARGRASTTSRWSCGSSTHPSRC